jgi:hypothetical protein
MWQLRKGGDGMFARIEPVQGQRWYQESQNGVLAVTSSGPFSSQSSATGGWSGDTLSFVFPYEIYKYDCPSTGCTHLIAGSNRVWETIQGGVPASSWYANSPNLTKQTLADRSFINQLSYSVSLSTTALVGTNDGNVQYGFGLGQGTANTATWVNVTGGNALLPNRPVLDVTTDPVNPLVGYAALGGFDQNTPSTPGHVYQVTCTTACASFTWVNKSGNLPNVPIDSILANPNFPQQVFAGSDWGLYYTNDITVASPEWFRFNTGMPNVMIWDLSIDRGFTTLAAFTRSRGAYVWPLPSGPFGGTPTPTLTPCASCTPTPTRTHTPAPPSSTLSPTTIPTHTPTNVPNTPPPFTETPTDTPVPPTITSTPCALSFSDVNPPDFFYVAVQYLACHGVISGYSDSTFRPYNNTTRGQLTKIIVLAEGWPQVCDTQHFTDVPPSHTFFCYIETAYNRSIISGYADGTFKPGNDVTRGQLSKIVVLAEGWTNDCANQHFSDVPPSHPFYCFVETAFAHSIISGYADGTFRPGNNATRGQISKIVYQAVTQP